MLNLIGMEALHNESRPAELYSTFCTVVYYQVLGLMSYGMLL
jgi:hypothetical protein